MALCYFRPHESASDDRTLGWVDRERRTVRALTGTLTDLLRLHSAARRERITQMRQAAAISLGLDDVMLFAPVDHQEVWAAGVTYERSRDARQEESAVQDVYARVYDAQRPEIFFKSAGWRCVGPWEPIGIRADSDWNVPEPELTLVLDAHGDIAGVTVGNDVSSRSIEGENPLYLPQAKTYTASAALGPWIVLLDDVADLNDLRISMRIERDAVVLFASTTSTRHLHRTISDLTDALTDHLSHPDGVFLMTGTGIVPPAAFTLQQDDVVWIEIEGIGTITNPVHRLSARARKATVTT